LANHSKGWIYVESDTHDFDLNFERMSNAPTKKGIAFLEATLFLAYEAQREATHVETGSLKSSTKKDSETRRHVWEGTITAGGASTGVNNPVNYAIYEKARGGAHDFQNVLDGYDAHWIVAVREAMD
jgi:hypothetical protein